MTKPSDDKGRVPGAQQHAEGEHGDRTRSRIKEQLHESPRDDADIIDASPREGHHRLKEDRQQHDEAEADSERNRQDREKDNDHE